MCVYRLSFIIIPIECIINNEGGRHAFLYWYLARDWLFFFRTPSLLDTRTWLAMPALLSWPGEGPRAPSGCSSVYAFPAVLASVSPFCYIAAYRPCMALRLFVVAAGCPPDLLPGADVAPPDISKLVACWFFLYTWSFMATAFSPSFFYDI